MVCKLILGLFIILPLLAAPLQAFAVSNGMVLYLPFDGNIKDASDNNNVGELRGKENWVEGKYDKALEFDGATHIEILDNENGLDNVSGLTIEVWVKQEEHHDNGIVVKLTSGSFWPCSYNLETWSDRLAYFDVGPDAGKYATAEYPLNEWFHLAGVFDGDKGEDRIYVNGQLGSTNPRAEKVVPDGNLPVCIGSVSPDQLFFRGALDDLVIYSRALTPDEIKKDMDGSILPVENAGKLSITWAAIKKQM